MAEVQELDQEVGELETVEQEIEQQQVEQAAEVGEDDSDIPPQFRGKSLKEIAKYAADTEKALSRQGNDLGELRKLTDELLRTQLAPKQEQDQAQKVDIFENPDVAIEQRIANNPEILAIKQMAIQARQEQAKAQFDKLHPDSGQIFQDPKFFEWVKDSPIRVQLLQAAHKNFDVAAGHELLSTYKELKAAKQKQVAEVDTKVRDKAMQAAAVDTGGSGESSRKVYRRADLIRLKMRDPAKYEAMQDEILAAYAEGRVK